MELKKYREEGSAIICSWIQDEKSLYQWSADRIGKFPLEANALSVGFRPVGRTEIYKMSVGEWECVEMELAIV